MSPEAQAMVEGRVREDVERNALRQREIDGKKVADEMERTEKEKIEKKLKEASAAKLREHRRPQQGDRVEYEVFRVGTDATQPWPSDADVRAILKNQPGASGTVFVTHFAIRFTHDQVVPTPVLIADASGDAAQADLRANNHFPSPSTAPSTAPMATPEQVGSIAGVDSPWVSGSLLRDPRRATQVVEGQVSSTTEPAESPMNETSQATVERVQYCDELQSAPTRQHSV